MMVHRNFGFIVLLGLVTTLVACNTQDVVSYSSDVRPILDQNCMSCHRSGGDGERISGFNMETYEDLMIGAQFGPMVIPGDAEGSNLIVLMEGRADPSISMPHGEGEAVPVEDIQTIRAWVEQGAKNN